MSKRKKRRPFKLVEMRDHEGEVFIMKAFFDVCFWCGRQDFLVPRVDMCGPCAFGEAETIGGNW